MKVYKRNGQEVDFALDKIQDAVAKANKSTFKKFGKEIEDIYSKASDYDPDDCEPDYETVMKITDDDFDWDTHSYEFATPGHDIYFPKSIGKDKFIKEISKYILVDGALDKVIEQTQKFLKPFDVVSVDDINDLVEKALMKVNAYEVAKEFITYRENKKNNKKFTDTEEKVLSVIDGTNEELRGDNANKHIDLNSSARDYIAGTVCKSIADKILPKEISKAHKEGYIHWHDKDYSPVQHMTNCCLLNTEDMLVNGFQMGDIHIDKPRRVSTAGNLLSQVALITSGQQYGGQTSSISCLLPIVKTTRIACAEELASELLELDYRDFVSKNHVSVDAVYDDYRYRASILGKCSYKHFTKIVEQKTRHDIHIGIKTYAWQILCHHSSNGQSPFTSLVLNLREAEDEQELKDLAFLIEEVIDRRIKGVTGSHGESMTPLFPKLLYWTCDGLNVNPEDPYYYLTKKAAKCITIRMAPDINSEKMSRKIKNGQWIPSMGCRSWLTALWIEKTYPASTKFHWQDITDTNAQYDGAPGKNFNYSKGFGVYDELPKTATKDTVAINFRGNTGWVKQFNSDGTVTIIEPKVFGRWNNGVVTVNIPMYAGEARLKVNKSHGNDTADFVKEYEIEYLDQFKLDFHEGLELCHNALLFRDNECKKIKAKNSPLLWMHGGFLRESDPEKTLGQMMAEHPLYNTISLGYVGLYETCMALINKSNSTKEGQQLSLDILKHINEEIDEWKKQAVADGNPTFNPSLYGTPEEQTTTRFALALKKHLGNMAGVTDHDYVTNSYHINPGEQISWRDKIRIEGQYLALTKGGAITYIETDNLKKNPEVIEEVIRYIHDNNSYAEVNTTLGSCFKCSYQGDFYLKTNDKHDQYYFECPSCHNVDQKQMDITMRLCGYIGRVNAGETTHGRMADFEARQHARHIKIAE